MAAPGGTDAPFPIRDVTTWPKTREEQMGSKRKVWLIDPAAEEDHLFKYVRQDDAGRTYGDDWAEKLAAELAGLLGIPAAAVNLAARGDEPGVICRRMNDPTEVELVHGNELLGAIAPDYDRDHRREHPLYSVATVRRCLDGATAHIVELPDAAAFDLWAGYLLFDAWIANTDRHHENWGVLVDRRSGASRLAPSFDHGTSLGFNIPSERLATALREPARLEQWCRRGRNTYFAGRPSLVQVAREALDSAGRRTRDVWLARLDRVRPDDWQRLLRRVTPERLSQPTRTFVDAMLTVNRRRLLDVDR